MHGTSAFLRKIYFYFVSYVISFVFLPSEKIRIKEILGSGLEKKAKIL